MVAHNSLPAPTFSHQHFFFFFFFIGGLQPYFSWCIPPPTVPEYVTTAFMYFPKVFLLEKTPHSSCSLQFTSQPHSLLHVSLTLHQYMFHSFCFSTFTPIRSAFFQNIDIFRKSPEDLFFLSSRGSGLAGHTNIVCCDIPY